MLRLLFILPMCFLATAAWGQRPGSAPAPRPVAPAAPPDSLDPNKITNPGTAAPLKPLQVGAPAREGTTISIPYEAPYDGMVEFKLYRQSQDKAAFSTQQFTRVGAGAIKLNGSKLPGGNYRFTIRYKGKLYEGQLTQ